MTTDDKGGPSYLDGIRAERHAEEEAHAARVARAAAAGTPPGDFARRATADAYELHAAVRATIDELRDDSGIAPQAPIFDLYACATRRDWNQDRTDACLRRGISLRLLRPERHATSPTGGPTFRLDGLAGGPCPTCGRPLTVVMPERREPTPDQGDLFAQPADDDDQAVAREHDGPCLYCWTNPHADADRRTLLEAIGREWSAYRTRPSQKASGAYDEGGAHPYMRYAFRSWGRGMHWIDEGREPEHYPFQPDDHPRTYCHRADDRAELRALAGLMRDGLVAMVDEPDRRANCLRATFGITAAGAAEIGLELDGLPEPVRGELRDHKPRGRTTAAPMTQPERIAAARAMTKELREARATTPAAPEGTPRPEPAPGAAVCGGCGHAVDDHSPTQSACLDFRELDDGRVIPCECPAPLAQPSDFYAAARALSAQHALVHEQMTARREAIDPADDPAALTLF